LTCLGGGRVGHGGRIMSQLVPAQPTEYQQMKDQSTAESRWNTVLPPGHLVGQSKYAVLVGISEQHASVLHGSLVVKIVCGIMRRLGEPEIKTQIKTIPRIAAVYTLRRQSHSWVPAGIQS
jgi:hypothetical protein